MSISTAPKGKILIIDDTVSIINMVKTALLSENYQVLIATSGSNGIKSAEKAKPDLILLDILMPEMDGYETCTLLKSNNLTKEIPVIFMSALTEVFDKVKAFSIGAVDYITKPLNVEELIARVDTQVKLYKLQEQLKSTNEILEQKVEERTKELKSRNDELQAAEEELMASNDALKENIEKLYKSEHRLLQSEKLLKESQSVGKVASWENNIEKGELIWSDEVFRMIGYEPQEFKPSFETFLNYIHPDDREKVGLAYTKSVEEKKVLYEVEHRLIKKDTNEVLFVQEKGQNIFNKKGEVVKTIGMVIDISEQKIFEQKLKDRNDELLAAEEELRATNDELKDSIQILRSKEFSLNEQFNKNQSILRAAPTGIGVTRNRVIVEINPQIEQITGYSSEEILGKESVFLYQNTQEFEKVGKEKYALIEKFGTGTVETKWVRKDGKLIDILLASTPIDLHDLNKGITFTALDITEQKIAERKRAIAMKELGHERDLLHSLMNNIPDTIYFKNTTSKFTRINKAQAKMLGIKNAKDAIGKTDFDFFTKEHAEGAFADEQEIVKTGKPVIDKLETVTNANGEIRYVSSTKVPIKNKSGKVTSIVGATRDITEHKKIELALKESEERFSLAMQASHDGLFDWDLITNEIYYSPTWKKILGYNDNELPNDFSVWEKLTHPDDVKKSWTMLNEHIEGKTDRFELEFKMQHKNGHWVPILSRASAFFDAHGKATRVVGTHIDITEIRNIEQKLVDNETLLKQSQAIAHVGSWAIQQNTELITWSDETYRIFGFEPKEEKVNFELFVRHIHPEDRDKVLKAYSKSIENKEKEYQIDHRIVKHKTKEIAYVVEKCQNIFDQKGEFVESIGMVMDITHRKIAELTLHKTNNALQDVIKASSAVSGQSYFNAMALSLERVSEASYSFIGEYIDKNAVKTIALSHKGNILKNITYELENTPCENVINKETCYYPENITKQFPKDQLLIDMGIEAYIGTPVFSHKNECLGILVSLYEKPIKDAEFVKSIFEIFAGKIGAEMERLTAEKALIEKNEELQAAEEELTKSNDELRTSMQLITDRENAISNIVNKTMGKSGNEFFNQMALVMSEVTKSEYTFIGELKTENSVKTLALVQKNKILENFEYSLVGTPCDTVLTEDTCIYTDGVCALFPDDQLLVDLKVDAYIGTSIRNSENKRIGIIASMYTTAIDESSFLKSLFEMFASKIGSEMERLWAEKALIEKNEELQAAEEELIASNDALKENLDKLAESETRFKALHNASFGGIAIHDLGIILETNQGMCDMTGYTYKELIGMNGLELISEALRDLVLENIKNKYEKPYEAEGVRKDGSKYPLRLEGRQIPYKGKEVRVVEFRDITEQKNAQHKLKQSEERFRTLAENTPGVIYLCHNDENYTMVYLNDAVKKLTGYKKEEFYSGSINIVDLYHPDYNKVIRETVDVAIRKKTSFRLEYKLKTKKGQWRWIEEYGAGIFDGDKLQFIEGSLMDITERKTSELINQSRLNIANYATEHSAKEVLQKTLDETEKLTESKIGFYHFVNEDSGDIHLHAWSTNTLKNMCSAEGEDMHYPIDKAGVWIDCIRNRKAVIHNDYMGLMHKKGLPIGHAEIIREVVVPVFRNKKIVAVLGVGNKTRDYVNEDVKVIEQLADLGFETVLRKQAEEKILNDRNRTLNIIEGTNAGTWEWLVSTNELVLNERWAEIIGYKLHEISTTYEFWFNSVHPDDRDQVIDKVEEHIDAKTENYDAEFRQKHKNGNWVWINARGKIIERNSKGEPLLMTGTHIDITEKKELQLAEKKKTEKLEKAEKKLLETNTQLNEKVQKLVESENKLNEAQHLAKLGYYNLDFSTGKWSNTTELDHIFGIGAEFERSVEGWLQIVHPDFREEMLDYFTNEIVKKHNPFDKEYKIVNQKTKQELWVHGQGKLEFDHNNNLTNMIGYIQDINQQVLAKRERVENEKQLQLIFDSSPATMFLVNENTEIIRMNKTGLELLETNMDLIRGSKTGDAFNCIVAIQNKNGCGTGYACKSCKIRNSLLSTIETKEQKNKVEAKLNIVNNGVIKSFTVLVSTTIATKSPNITYLVTIDDISERKKVEKAIIESEKRFRTIIESANDAIFIADSKTGIIVDVNQKGMELIGHKKGELIGKHQSELYIQEGRHILETLYAEDINDKSKPIVQEVFLQHKSGQKIPVEISPARFKLDDGSGYFVGFFRDISKRRKAEKALEESYIKYKTLADYTYDWEYWKDPNGKYNYISPACKRITGYSVSEFMTTPSLFDELIIEEDKDKWTDHVEEAENRIACKTPKEFRIKTKKGKIVWINHICQPVFDSGGNFIGNRGTNRDVSLRKAVELDLIESKDRFQQLADTTNEGIIIHKKGEIVDVNKTILKMSGYSEYELLGRDVFETFVPTKFYNIVNESMLHSNPPAYEISALKKDGSLLPVEIKARNISKTNKTLRVISIRDITEQKQMQQKILQAVINTEEQERKRVAQELHDGLGPILSASKLYVETFLRTDSQTYKEKAQKNLLAGIDEALKQVASISNNLSPHVLNDFGLEAAINKFIDRVMSLNAIHIEFTFASELKISSEIETSLYRITTELVNNTLKYAKAEHVFIHIFDSQENIHLLYKDDGIGFDFEKTKQKKGGMGLFNITSRIQTFNGTLNFEKPKGRGIIYEISIPIKN